MQLLTGFIHHLPAVDCSSGKPSVTLQKYRSCTSGEEMFVFYCSSGLLSSKIFFSSLILTLLWTKSAQEHVVRSVQVTP